LTRLSEFDILRRESEVKMIINKHWKDVVSVPPNNELESVDLTLDSVQFNLVLEALYELSRQYPTGLSGDMDHLKNIVDLYFNMKY